MSFVSVLDLSGKTLVAGTQGITKKKSKTKKQKERGCSFCTLNKSEDAKKLIRIKKIKQRKIFIWTTQPGEADTEEEMPLVGPAGKLLWSELRAVGIKREDCDIQYVVRCRPTTRDDRDYLSDRQPTKDELHCCSLWTEKALEKSKAKIHLVFGQVTAKQLLGREYKKEVPLFWSEKLQARIAVLDHPSYFLKHAPKHRLTMFRERLKAAAGTLGRKIGGKYGYLDEQKYVTITNYDHAVKVIQRAMKTTERVSVDIEDGWVNPVTGKADLDGRHVILTFGMSWKPGVAYTFPIDHPDIFKKNRRTSRKIIRLIGKLMSSVKVQKTQHHGTHDVTRVRELWKIKTRGYNFDTNYSTYLRWPDLKGYGLDKLSKSKVTEFAGYKDIVKPHFDVKAVNYATIPLKVLAKYNCADADLSKRLELLTKNVEGPLMEMYVRSAFFIDDMQKRGPYFDKVYDEQVAGPRTRKRFKIVKKRLIEIAGRKDINLNAWQQTSVVLYDKLHLPVVDEKNPRGTGSDILRILAQGKRGEFPGLLDEYRVLSKMDGTYLKNYRKSAEINDGQLRTLWWLTGTITGRLSSGGSKKADDDNVDGIVNLQNLHGNAMLKNLLVSDTRWRRVLSREARRLFYLQLFSAFDYSQIEIRILAHMSGDPRLMEAVESGDIHGTVGETLTGISRAIIKTDENTRRMIKGLHFGIVYGLVPKSLHAKLTAEGVKITLQRTQELYNEYFRKYRRVRELIEFLKESAERKGYAETLFGFRRPVYQSGDESGRQSRAENQAVNSPIQGSAHNLMLIAMAIVPFKKQTYWALQKPLAEVHDALYNYHRVDELQEVFKQGKHLLEVAVPEYVTEKFGFSLKVPITCECKSGFRMGSMMEHDGQMHWKKFLREWKEKNEKVEAKITDEWKNKKRIAA